MNIVKLNPTQVQITISCINPELAEIIVKGLEPENSLLNDNTKIVMKRDGRNVEISIESLAEISSIRYTLDDILNTISTIEKVFLSASKLEKQQSE
ncbi:MAG: KEOPS complex subunit Pcc1 [Candidatus Heimdallarchaeaceae archaeon]